MTAAPTTPAGTHLDYAVTSYRPNGEHGILFTTTEHMHTAAQIEGKAMTGAAVELPDGQWHYNYTDKAGVTHARLFPHADALTAFVHTDPTVAATL